MSKKLRLTLRERVSPSLQKAFFLGLRSARMQVEKEGIHALSQSDEEETDIQELLVDDDGEEGGE